MNTSTTLIWRERPMRELMRLAWPITVSQISFSLLTAVDTLFVGRLGAAALAGVALGGMATFTLMCFAMGVLRSTKIVIAQAVGAHGPEAGREYLGASLTAALGLGIMTALIGQAAALLLPLLTASEESGRMAASYASIRLLSAPVLMIAVALREARHGVGDTRMPMIAALVENVVNVALVWFLLIVLGGGVAQVAWATTLAQCSEALALIWMQRKHGFGLRGWSAADLRLLMKLGGPLGLERFFDVASFSLMIALFARMGDQELASHQVANQALLFTFMPSMALGEANCVLIGQAVGAGSLRTVPRIQRAALLVCFVYIAACSCAFSCFGAQLAGLFTFDPALTERAAGLFRIAGVFVWVVPFYQVGQSSLRGIGDVRSAAWITVIAAWFCTPLLAAVFGFGFGLGARGGWVGLGTELGLAGLCFWARWRSGESWLWRARRVRARLRTGSRRGNDTPANPAGSEDVDVPTRLSTPPLEAAG